MLGIVCGAYFRAHIAWMMTAFNLLARWGLEIDEHDIVRLPIAEFSLLETNTIGYYRQALTLAQALGMRPLVAHCHRGLGVLYAATGQREQAHATLSTAIALYRDMEMRLWLPHTEATLVKINGHDR